MSTASASHCQGRMMGIVNFASGRPEALISCSSFVGRFKSEEILPAACSPGTD